MGEEICSQHKGKLLPTLSMSAFLVLFICTGDSSRDHKMTNIAFVSGFHGHFNGLRKESEAILLFSVPSNKNGLFIKHMAVK